MVFASGQQELGWALHGYRKAKAMQYSPRSRLATFLLVLFRYSVFLREQTGHLLELYYSCSSAYGQTHKGCCLFYRSCLGSETLAKARRTSSQYTMRQGRPYNKKIAKVNLCSSSKKFTNLYLLLFLNSLCPIFSTQKNGMTSVQKIWP